MVERKISSSQEIKEKYQKSGIVIFIMSQEGEILLVKENTANPTTGREIGNYGVICETSNENEDWETTTIRGLKEELGIDPGIENNYLKIDPKNCFLGESLFVDGVLARVVVTRWMGDKEKISSLTNDGEISIVGWEKPENLFSYPLRVGVKKVLEECLQEGLLKTNSQTINNNESFLSLSVNNLKQIAQDFS